MGTSPGSRFIVIGPHFARDGAFWHAEQTVIAHLGEIIGHAIAAAERKRALMSDTLVDLERVIPIGDNTFRIDGEASADTVENIEI